MIASIFELIVAQPREHVKVSQLQRVKLADTQHSFANVYGRILSSGHASVDTTFTVSFMLSDTLKTPQENEVCARNIGAMHHAPTNASTRSQNGPGVS